MKKVLLFSFILLSFFSLNAQTTTAVLTGTSPAYKPIIPMAANRYHRSCYLITPAEMKAAGIKYGAQFSNIIFSFYQYIGESAKGNLKIYLQNTTDTCYYHSSTDWSNGVNGIIDSAIMVHNAATTIPSYLTNWSITFSDPANFMYTGGGIYVSFDYSNPTGYTALNLAGVNSSGPPSGGTIGTRYSVSNSAASSAVNNYYSERPSTRLTYTLFDANIAVVYAPGKTPLFNNTPVSISTCISNYSYTPLNNVKVTLNVTGANSFTDTKTINIPYYTPQPIRVDFDSFIPTVEGDNMVTVTLAPDADSTKNKMCYYMKTTQTNFSYADTSQIITSSTKVYYSPLFYVKYFIKGNTKVSSVSCYINNFPTLVGMPVYGVIVNHDAHTIITRTPEYIIQQSDLGKWLTLDFPNPPVYNDTYAYVGLAQVADKLPTDLAVGYQYEAPERGANFYSQSNLSSIWIMNARFLVQANLSTNNSSNNLIYSPEGLNMPGLFNGWINPPSIKAFSGIQTTGGNLLPADNNSHQMQRNTRMYSTIIKAAASGGDCTGGAYPFLFTSGPASNYYQNKWGGVNVVMKTAQSYVYNSAADNNVTLADGNYYVVNWIDNGYADTKAMWMPISASPAKISFMINKFYSAGKNDTVIVIFDKSIQENFFVRYSTDNWKTWGFIQGVNNPNPGIWVDTIVIPANLVSSNGSFYVMTSGLSLAELNALTLSEDVDLATISAYQGAFTTSLPVELTSFTADVKGSSVLLNWSTATELNNKGFEVQRKSSDGNWITAGFVNGAGSSSESVSYSFIDKNIASGKYSYRLKQIDFNGEYKYSDIVNVDVTAPESFSLSQNYPNPFNPTTRIEYNIPVDAMVKLEVFSVTGEKISELVNTELNAGYYSADVNSSALKGAASGVYLYKLTATEKQSGKNFVSTHKMLLLK